MKNEVCIPLHDYVWCRDIYCDRCKDIIDLIAPSEAIFGDNNTEFIDIEIYNQYILSTLEDLKKDAEEVNTCTKAYHYACTADFYFNDRRRYIDHVASNYADPCANKRCSFNRDFTLVLAEFRSLFEHIIQAHELVFRSTPTSG